LASTDFTPDSATETPAPTPAQPAGIPTGPLTIGDLLDRIFRVYRARFGVLVLTAAILLVPVALINGLTTGQFMVGYLDFLQNLASSPTATPGPVFGTFAVYAAAILGIAVLGGLASGAVNLAITVHVLRFYNGEVLTVGQGIQRALPRLWHLVLLYLTQAAAIFTATAVVVLAVVIAFALVGLAVGGAALVLFQDTEVGGPLAFIGLMVLFICGYVLVLALIGLPIFYLSARWIVAVPSLVNEGLGPIAALRRSWRLTTRNVWRCAFYLILLFILSSLVVSVPLAVLQQALMLMPIPTSVAFSASTAVGSLFNIVWQPLYATGMALLYYDLRVRRESLDVAQQVARLESELARE
jgi:hypothetical protein